MSVSGISAYYENHLALLEKYWLAEEKEKFLQSIHNANDKKLLHLLVEKLPQNYKKIFDELKLPKNVRTELLNSKMISAIQNAKTEEEKVQSVQAYIHEYFKNMSFDYPKPVQNTSFSTGNEQSIIPESNSKLELPENLQTYLEELIQKDYRNFQTLTQFGFKQLKESYLLNLNEENKRFLLGKNYIFKTFSDEFVAKFLLSYAQPLALIRKVPFYEQIPGPIIQVLSKTQINTLKSLKPQIMNFSTFVKKWFQINYLHQIELKQQNNQAKPTLKELNQRRKILFTVKEEIKKLDVNLLKDYEDHLIYEILVLDLKRQDPDKDIFYQFLSKQQGISSFFNKTFREEITKKYGRRTLSSYSTINSSNLLSCNCPIDKLISNYLTKMFKKYKNSEELKQQLSKYLEFNTINSCYARVKLEEGEEVQNLNDILPKSEVEELKKSKQITIVVEKTSKFFKSQDDVTLTIKTKNIKQIKLKIYEINMEQFYLENPNSNIDQTINLQYLNPTHEELIQIKDFKNSFQVLEQELLVGEIPKGCGIFIVELVGQGITSRAVIKKGAIACFEESHIDGKLVKFYDEQGNLIENIRIWIDGRNEILKNAEYLIPFTKKYELVRIFAIRDNFVQKFSVALSQQQYFFDVGLIYNHESFIVGKKAKVILHPVLKLGNSKVSVENMENIKVSANLVNNQNIKSSQKFENVKFLDEKDFVLEVPIKSYTKTIEIAVEGDVKDLQGKVVELSWRKTITIELLEGTNNFIDMYLNRANKGKSNILKVRGLNGEPMQNLDVVITPTILGTARSENIIRKTNKDGEIQLGTLNYVSNIKASINTNFGTISRSWNISQIVDEVSYLDKFLIYHKDDSIKIPLPSLPDLTQENLHHFLNFSQTHNQRNQEIYVNKISSLKILHQGSFNFLAFEHLEPGMYQISFLMFDKTLMIKVISGKKWPNGSIFDENERTVYKITQSNLLFTTIGQLSEEKGEKQGINKIKIPIHIPQEEKDKLESVRVHVFLKNNSDSLDNNLQNSFSLQNYTQNPEFRTQQLSSQQSTYYNNKPLSDEQAYVINRENEKQFIGNNLEKPRVFLKRIEVRDTTEKDEVLARQGLYNKQCDDTYRSYGGGGGMEKCAAYRDMPSYMVGGYAMVSYDLNSHNNFYSLSGHCLLNCKFNKILSINIPEGYSEAVVYLITQNSAIKKNFFFELPSDEKTKDIKHLGLEEKNQTTGWSMSREIYQLQKKEKRQVSRDSLFCTVSLSNVLQFAQIKGFKLPLWVSQWSSYTEAKKLQVYDKEVCHELNVYVKRQDPEFFKRVVEPFIRNKITKTFVDLYLLGDKQALSFAVPHKIQTLNEFEKVLLIEALVENGVKETASDIATSMELSQKSVKRSFETFKELFDIVLNSEAGSPKPPVTQSYQQATVQNAMLFGMAPAAMHRGRGSKVVNSQMRSLPPGMALKQSLQRGQEMDVMNFAMAMDEEEGSESQQEYQMQGIKSMRSSQKRKKKSSVLRSPSKRTLKQGFKEVERTKQYTQTTYAGIKNPKESTNLIQSSPFWAHLATYLAQADPSKDFLSEGFLYFTKPIEFTLACCFLNNVSHADYELSNESDNYIIEANNSFMLFVKQVKELNYNDKFGVLINQRFFNPQERYTYEDDGTQIQKLVDQFIIKKPYTLQTVVTNTSGTNLELQLLMDIPSNAIPLKSHQNVQIINVNVNSFSTTSFERIFYFPSEGKSVLYPANASRNNVVIAKAKKLLELEVKSTSTVNKLESLSDVMRSGSKKEILEYIEKRNIFDSKIFSSYSILWMLKDKEFFEQVIKIFRKRNFFDQNIWSFGIYHKDTKSILEYLGLNELKPAEIPIFEYFPYFSRRAHKFMDENKSTIRNVQFKETYKNFVVSTLIFGQTSSIEKTALAYYLLLQDRIDECASVFKSLSENDRKAHEIQTDYLACYLSMYQDYPNFTTAQTISEKYQNYPIVTWSKIFKEIYDTLKEYREDIEIQEEAVFQAVSEFKTTYIQEGQLLKINIPANTKVQVYFYDINLELYFSDFPFEQIQSLSVVKPKVSKVFNSGESREEKIKYADVQYLGNMIVQVYEFKEGIPAAKIGSFFWANPKLKVKITQNQGLLQVFYDGKRQPGCYVKVYSTGNKGTKFYRDGYTDITGKFKYVLGDLQGLTKFSILAITSQGGIINQVSPPSTLGHY